MPYRKEAMGQTSSQPLKQNFGRRYRTSNNHVNGHGLQRYPTIKLVMEHTTRQRSAKTDLPRVSSFSSIIVALCRQTTRNMTFLFLASGLGRPSYDGVGHGRVSLSSFSIGETFFFGYNGRVQGLKKGLIESCMVL